MDLLADLQVGVVPPAMALAAWALTPLRAIIIGVAAGVGLLADTLASFASRCLL